MFREEISLPPIINSLENNGNFIQVEIRDEYYMRFGNAAHSRLLKEILEVCNVFYEARSGIPTKFGLGYQLIGAGIYVNYLDFVVLKGSAVEYDFLIPNINHAREIEKKEDIKFVFP